MATSGPTETVEDETKKYVSLAKIRIFFTNLKQTFAAIVHTHTISDLTDYVVDYDLDASSNNPVRNKAISQELKALKTEIGSELTKAQTYDDEISETSTNAVQNKVITEALNNCENAIYILAERDIPIFEITCDSDSSTYSLADVTFDELDSYASQNKMVILRYGNRMFPFTRRIESNDAVYLYYYQPYATAFYYFLLKNDGSIFYYTRTLMGASDELITTDDIDTICGATITNAAELTF